MKTMKTNPYSIAHFLLIAAVAFGMAACDSSDSGMDDDPGLVPKQEGFYVYGKNTMAEDVQDPDARMSRALLDSTQGSGQKNMPGVYGKYMYIGANGTVQFANYEEETSTQYGLEGGGSLVSGADLGNVPLTSDVISGDLVEDGSPAEVEEEGLYYTFVNMNDNTVVIMKVEPRIIGDATEGQWDVAASTPLPMQSGSESGAVFEATDVKITGEKGYKYMFSEGYSAYASPDVVTRNFLGVESYADAWAAGEGEYDVGFYYENIPSHQSGIYTVRLEYDAETDSWTETLEKTGEVVADYSDTEMAIIGTAVPGGSFAGDGTGGYDQKAPSVEGNVYTWTWDNVDLAAENEFIFLEGATWGGFQIAYDGAAVQGAAADDGQIVNATDAGGENPNFYVAEGGTYDIALTVNAEDGSRVVTIEPAG